MSEQLVEVKDLKVTYYQNGVETPVVRNVSFEIKKNETLGLVGESGRDRRHRRRIRFGKKCDIESNYASDCRTAWQNCQWRNTV